MYFRLLASNLSYLLKHQVNWTVFLPPLIWVNSMKLLIFNVLGKLERGRGEVCVILISILRLKVPLCPKMSSIRKKLHLL